MPVAASAPPTSPMRGRRPEYLGWPRRPRGQTIEVEVLVGPDCSGPEEVAWARRGRASLGAVGQVRDRGLKV